jgi:nitrite reductase/ring-hydroxylating ferredoxin subunit
MHQIQGETVGSTREASEGYLGTNTMRMHEVDGRPIAVIRTEAGVFAVDNACPHQGYGLVTGDLGADADGAGVVTCLWHNWKFRVSDGVCVLGEENVACHDVSVDDAGTVRVTINRPSPEDQLRNLWPSLTPAIQRNYVGQMSRGALRLLDNGARPAEVMAAAITGTVDRTEDGADHEVALAADCLAIAEERTGDDRVLPLVVALSGLAEQTRDRPPIVAERRLGGDLVQLIESEDLCGAMGRAATLDIETARKAMVEAARNVAESLRFVRSGVPPKR